MWWVVAIVIAQAIICSFLSNSLANQKGYDSGLYAALGFFLGIFGLIYAVGLPLSEYADRENMKYLAALLNSKQIPDTRTPGASPVQMPPVQSSLKDKGAVLKSAQKYMLCPKCQEPQNPNTPYCNICGAKLS